MRARLADIPDAVPVTIIVLSMIGESADASGVNRRDVILPNHAPGGFWKSMRDAYKADYIVVEAKNYKRPITKTQALQVANYLKPHGAGMFAIIATRNGANASCMGIIREQWTTYGKMMVVLTGDDIKTCFVPRVLAAVPRSSSLP